MNGWGVDVAVGPVIVRRIGHWFAEPWRRWNGSQRPADGAATGGRPPPRHEPAVDLVLDFKPYGGGDVVLSNTSKSWPVPHVSWIVDGNVGVPLRQTACPEDGSSLPPRARWVIAEFPPMSREQRPLRINVMWTGSDGGRHARTETLYI